MRVALVQFTPKFQERSENWNRILAFARKETADVVVFPELSSCGYAYEKRQEIAPFTDSSEALGGLEELAGRTGQLFVGGFAEKAGADLFDSAYAVGPKGTEVYRKLHLWNFEKELFRPGDRLVTVPYEGHRVGVEVCYDLQFPEQATALARLGVDLIAVPMAWAQDERGPSDGLQPYSHLAIATAYSLGIPVLIANRTGTERGARFPGESSITDPFGRQERLDEKEGVLRAEVDFELIPQAKHPTPRNDLDLDRRLRVEPPTPRPWTPVASPS